jgi:hypothetical protein
MVARSKVIIRDKQCSFFKKHRLAYEVAEIGQIWGVLVARRP